MDTADRAGVIALIEQADLVILVIKDRKIGLGPDIKKMIVDALKGNGHGYD